MPEEYGFSHSFSSVQNNIDLVNTPENACIEILKEIDCDVISPLIDSYECHLHTHAVSHLLHVVSDQIFIDNSLPFYAKNYRWRFELVLAALCQFMLPMHAKN